jgi:hypothetical protein
VAGTLILLQIIPKGWESIDLNVLYIEILPQKSLASKQPPGPRTCGQQALNYQAFPQV